MNYNKLIQLEQSGIIYGNNHPTYSNLRQYNYSQETQYNKLWCPHSIQCRGLIVDTHSNKVVARPFPKFFNYEELTGLDWTTLYDIPQTVLTEPFTAYNKEDGSLLIVYYYNGWHTATRGSFQSEQAICGRKLLDNKYGQYCLNPDYTFLFEYVGPENRIVVPYSEENVILLGVIHTESGYELTEEEIVALDLPFDRPKIYTDISSLASAEIKKDADGTCNFEGFVLCFRYGNRTFRVKLKASTYCALHRIMSNFTPKRVFESLRNNTNIDLSDVPDEFFDEYTKIKENFLDQYKTIETIALDEFYKIIVWADDNKEYRKKFAEKAKLSRYPSILFSILDGKPYNQIIWKILEKDLCLLSK